MSCKGLKRPVNSAESVHHREITTIFRSVI
jgi:hypothetical protein